MAILSRMFRICKADIHGVMDQIEDRGLLLKQYLREMEASLEEKTARLQTVERAIVDIEKEVAARRSETEKLDADIDGALHRDRDDIARTIIRKRRTIAAVCERMASRREILVSERESLAEKLEHQRLQYEELKTRAAVYCRGNAALSTAAADLQASAGAGLAVATEDEVELELLRRKETLQTGGEG